MGFLVRLACFYASDSDQMVCDFRVSPERTVTIHAGSPYPCQLIYSRYINNLTELLFAGYGAAAVPKSHGGCGGPCGLDRISSILIAEDREAGMDGGGGSRRGANLAHLAGALQYLLGKATDKGLFLCFQQHYGDWFPALTQIHRTTFVRQSANLWWVKGQLWRQLLQWITYQNGQGEK